MRWNPKPLDCHGDWPKRGEIEEGLVLATDMLCNPIVIMLRERDEIFA